ncbi:gamma-glutamylcyclotransferase family protein [Methanolobus profundi]|uniref:Uncharacterized conserved protein YtfP, gamma-glutamylcyclotransferase (GGCT)/AIG2-like family n=1 Tax=Methanolobus profundi TaxID=487685 RepID=A0A1I4PAA4_9EURY|nr:gamma-glutamylcyclotransferase family protein [Methanolobus profundi]SFM24718.1 Uncharacterized conserved protein YtfP, gamma-glutamylcyclotransferase (GGCT)/AIG2-like family [Methanolobus profundi]
MYIFVYGTLKRSDPNHFLLKGSEFICSTRTKISYTMLDLGRFPGVIKDEVPKATSSPIYGEVYDIDQQTLEKLDAYEGSWYFREEVELETGLKALMYFLRKIPPLEYHVITDGNWKRHN